MLVVAVAAVLSGPEWVKASVIFDYGAPDQSNGIDMTAWIQSERFTIASASTVTGVNFWDFEQSGTYTGNISWAIASTNANGTPASILASGTVAPGHVATGVILNIVGQTYTEYENSFTISPVSLVGGVTYALELHNGSSLTSPSNRREMFWEVSNRHLPPYGFDYFLQFGGPWESNGGALAFQLTGSTTTVGTPVPEPSTFVLLALGGICLAVGAHRRRRRISG